MSKAPRLTLNDPTELMLAVADYKGFEYETTETREIMPGVFGPSISFGPDIAVGESGAIGWMDRRHPYPPLFPSDINQYSRVTTLSYALDKKQIEAPRIFYARDESHPFLFGRHPTLADVLLALGLKRAPQQDDFDEFIQSVFDYCGPQNLAGA